MAGSSARGEELLLEAIEIHRELVNRYSDIAVYSAGLIQSLKRLSELQRSLGKSEKAQESKELADKEILRMRKNVKPPKLFAPVLDQIRNRSFLNEGRPK